MTYALALLAAGPSGESTSTWLILLVPLVVVAALVALAMYFRGGPPTAHGYAIHRTPRRRHHVAPWVVTLLRPVLAYNEHRRAYVLRGVGNRLGPVLRRRPEPAEMLPQPPRTGRFQRVEPASDEPVAVEVAPRAPVGARSRSQARPSGRPAAAQPKPSEKSKPPPGKRARSKGAGRDR